MMNGIKSFIPLLTENNNEKIESIAVENINLIK
jgi:hypothetical protein